MQRIDVAAVCRAFVLGACLWAPCSGQTTTQDPIPAAGIRRQSPHPFALPAALRSAQLPSLTPAVVINPDSQIRMAPLPKVIVPQLPTATLIQPKVSQPKPVRSRDVTGGRTVPTIAKVELAAPKVVVKPQSGPRIVSLPVFEPASAGPSLAAPPLAQPQPIGMTLTSPQLPSPQSTSPQQQSSGQPARPNASPTPDRRWLPVPRQGGNRTATRRTTSRLTDVDNSQVRLQPPPTYRSAASARRTAAPASQFGKPLVSADGKIRLVAGEGSVFVPLDVQPPDANVNLQGKNGSVTLIATGAELKSVLRMIADYHHMNLVLGPEVAGPVTVSIRGARLEEVLDAILGVAGFSWHRVDNLLYVTSSQAEGMDPRVQGRTVQVYPLDYVAATDVQGVANGLLSPVGNAYISESDSADQLKTREVLVVEDTPSAHERIARFIAQIDVPPKQVLVEAHVLQISLDEEERHGIDLKALARVDGSSISLEGTGFTDTGSGDATVALRVNGRDMTSVIELIRRQTNSRTLASPKLSVINHQEAKIQIGQRLPYSVATTTQTTTVQSVEFLEVGIVLTVRPVITDDGNVLMYVLPKVSGGKITQNGFPEEETTEVQTTIMIPDGGGVIIGGLIREEHLELKASVPYFSKVPVLGNLFKRRSEEVRRNELIVALVTHVIPNSYGPRTHEVMELENTLPDYAAREVINMAPPVVVYE